MNQYDLRKTGVARTLELEEWSPATGNCARSFCTVAIPRVDNQVSHCQTLVFDTRKLEREYQLWQSKRSLLRTVVNPLCECVCYDVDVLDDEESLGENSATTYSSESSTLAVQSVCARSFQQPLQSVSKCCSDGRRKSLTPSCILARITTPCMDCDLTQEENYGVLVKNARKQRVIDDLDISRCVEVIRRYRDLDRATVADVVVSHHVATGNHHDCGYLTNRLRFLIHHRNKGPSVGVKMSELRKNHGTDKTCLCDFPYLHCEDKIRGDWSMRCVYTNGAKARKEAIKNISKTACEYIRASEPCEGGFTTTRSWDYGHTDHGPEPHQWMRGPDGRKWLDIGSALRPTRELSFEYAAAVSFSIWNEGPEWYFHPYFMEEKEPKFDKHLSYDQILRAGRSDNWTLDNLRRHNALVDEDLAELKKHQEEVKKWSSCVPSGKMSEPSPNAQIGMHHTVSIEIPGLTELADMLTQVNGELDWVATLRELMFACMHIYQASFSLASILTSLAQFFVNTPTKLKVTIKNEIYRLFTKNAQGEGVNAQAKTPMLATGLAAAVCAVVALATSRMPSNKTIDAVINRFSKVGHMIGSVEKISVLTASWTSTVEKLVGVHLLGHDLASYDEWKTIDDWCDEVQNLMTVDFEQRCRSEKQILGQVNTLIERGSTISKELDAARVPFVQRARVTSSQMWLMQARRIASGSGAGMVKPRTAPSVVHIYGESGVGKSTMLAYLTADILSSLGYRDPDDLHSKVYYRRPTDENWDGYRNGMEIVVCDDFGALKDSAARPNPQVQEQIHMANTAHFPLAMAHLEDKGTTVFEAKAVIWTTNRSHFAFDSMTNPEAVYNRVSLKFRQRVDPEFACEKDIDGQTVTTLDRTKLEEALERDAGADMRAMVFDLIHPTSRNESVLKEGLTYDEMSKLVVEEIKARETAGRSFLAKQKLYFERKNAQAAYFVAPTFFERIRHPMGGSSVHVNVWETLVEVEHKEFEIGETSGPVFNVPGCMVMKEAEVEQSMSELAWAMHKEGGAEAWAIKWQPVVCMEHHCACQESMLKRVVDASRRQAVTTWNWVRGSKVALTLLFGAVAGFLAYSTARVVKACHQSAEEKRAKQLRKLGVADEEVDFWDWVLTSDNSVREELVDSLKELYSNSEAYSKDVRTAARKNHEAYEKTAQTYARKNHEAYEKTPQTHVRKNHEGFGKMVPNIQAFSDPAAGEIRTLLFKNTWCISSTIDSKRYVHGTVTFVKGRIAVTNRHVLALCGDYITIESAHGRREYNFHKNELVTAVLPDDGIYGYKDLVAFECPRSVALHSDITKHFMTKEDYSGHDFLARVAVVGYHHDGYIKVQETDCARARDRADFRLVDSTLVPRYVREVYEYAVNTEMGDCGSIVLSFDKRFPRKILGIHMAAGEPGSKYTGVGVAIHQEALRELLSLLVCRWPESGKDATPPVRSPLEVNVNSGRFEVAPTSVALPHIGTTYREFENTHTQISPTPVAHLLPPPITRPATLRVDKQGRDPALLALQKAVTPTITARQDLIDQATAAFTQTVLSREVLAGDLGLLSYEEAISGRVGDAVYQPINRAAGPGYGWEKKGRGKRHWFGDDDWKYDDPEIRERFEECEEKLHRGERVEMVWNDTLKDELRPHAKVDACKTRLFSAGEMVFTMLLRMYFMGFCAHIMRNPIAFESCVGINPLGRDWTILARRLQSKGRKVIAGDFTNYDGTLCTQLLWASLDVIESFYATAGDYDPTTAEIRRTLWLEIVQSVHNFRGDLYEWTHSQPSGCAFTTILNSIYHSLAMRYVYLKLAEVHDIDLMDMESYDRYVAHINYGDDDVTNVAETIVGWFNQETITEAYKELGMVYTDETKAGVSSAFRSLEDIRFLKRSFEWDSQIGMYRAPLEKEKILEIGKWKGKGDAWTLTKLELEAAAAEAAQLDRSGYEEIAAAMEPARRACSEHVPTWFHPYIVARRVAISRALPWCFESSNSSSGVATRQNAQSAMIQVDRSVTAKFADAGEGRAVPSTVSCSRYDTSMEEYTTTAVESEGVGGPSFAGTVTAPVREQIVEFNDDGAVAESSQGRDEIPSAELRAGMDMTSNEITSVLGRPILATTFDWSASTGALGTLARIHLPHDWLGQPMVQQKLTNFKYLRCDFVVEVQVNAQPFNAGMLIGWFEPLAQQNSAQPSSAVTLAGVTGYPNVQWRCGEETALKLRIPYISPTNYIDLVTGLGTLGDFVLDIMSPLTGSADVNGAIWFWAENIRFEMPTGQPLVLTNAQAGRVERAPAATQNSERSAGTVTTLAASAAKVSRAAEAVPGVGVFAGAATSVLNAVSGVASLFGWSKPQNDEFVEPMWLSSVKNMANYNGRAEAKVLALDAQNAVDIPHELFRASEDEMALAHILQKEIFTDVFTWNSDKTTGNVLWKWAVDPAACRKVKRPQIQSNLYAMYNNYLSYLSRLFTFWRGGIKYHIKLVKTPFHSGRIQVAFLPGATLATDLTTVDFAQVYKKIYDVRQITDIEFEVPYTWQAEWKNIYGQQKQNEPMGVTSYDPAPTGIVVITVLNSLRAPSTAASSIEGLVFVSAGADFQFAVPRMSAATAVTTRGADVPAPTYTMNAQSAMYPAQQDTSTKPNSRGIGEIVASLRQLLKRYYGVTLGTTTFVAPFTTHGLEAIGVIGDLARENTPFLWVGELFRFYAGSLRIMQTASFAGAEALVDFSGITPGGDSELPLRTTPGPVTNPAMARAPRSLLLEPTVEFQLPFYQEWPALPTDLGAPARVGEAPTAAQRFRVVPSNEGTYLNYDHDRTDALFRHIGEDFSFGYLLGPPVTWIWPISSTPIP